jgi:hypothetical protein
MDHHKPKELIEPFKQAIAEVWYKDSQSTWPIELNSVNHLFLDSFAAELLEDVQRLKTAGLEEAAIAAKFKTSARIIRLILPCVLGLKASQQPTAVIQNQVAYLLALAQHLKHGLVSNREGKNIVLTPTALERVLDQRKMAIATRNSSLQVHKLCAICWNFAECLGFRAHGLFREFHGPYYMPGQEEEILIRDFIDLNPLDLWKATRAIKYKNLRVVTAYRDLGISIDIYDNVSIREDTTYVSSLKAYYIEADGKLLPPEEVERLGEELAEVILAISGEVEAMDWRQLAGKYAEIFWYGKKELKAGRDWHPPRGIHERIEKGELSTRLQNLSPQALQRMLRISF